MSAKVVKKEAAVSAAPFMIAEIGEGYDLHEAPAYEQINEALPKQMDSFASLIDEGVGEALVEDIAGLHLQSPKAEAEREQFEAIERDAQQRTAEMREELCQTLAALDGLRHQISVNAEKEIVELALEIAKKIVSREVMFDREIALTLVKVSLKKINSRAPLAQIHLHPEDHAYIESRRDQLDFRGTLELIVDRSISPGGCLVHTENGEVDARIESQFEEIAHALLGN